MTPWDEYLAIVGDYKVPPDAVFQIPQDVSKRFEAMDVGLPHEERGKNGRFIRVCQDGTSGERTFPRSGRLRAYIRIDRDAPQFIKILFYGDLISDRVAARLSPANPTPDHAEMVEYAARLADHVAHTLLGLWGVPKWHSEDRTARRIRRVVDRVTLWALGLPPARITICVAGVPVSVTPKKNEAIARAAEAFRRGKKP